MSRTETLRRSVSEANSERLQPIVEAMDRIQQMHEDLGTRIEALRVAATQAGEDTAKAMLPAAQAMAALIEESKRQAVALQKANSKTQQDTAKAISDTVKQVDDLAKKLNSALLKLQGQADDTRQAIYDAAAEKPINPWIPASVCALTAALVPTLAILWLAWRVGALKF